MKALFLSWFDAVFGPRIFLHSPGVKPEDFKHVPPLMDLYREGFFYHEIGKDKIANMSFQIPSNYARGNYELLMITCLVRDGEMNPVMAKEHLVRFVDSMVLMNGAYKAFYVESSKHAGEQKKLDEMRGMFEALFHSIPVEINVFKHKDRKIFVFGPTKAGKTTILQAMQNRLVKQLQPTIFVDISKVLIPDTNISVMIFDAPGQIKYREMWAPNLVGQDGLVFVVDVAEKERFEEARAVLHDVALRPQTRQLPLLLLFNKIDLKKPKIKDLLKELDLDALGLGSRPIKYFETSALTGEGIAEAFRWLGKELAKN